MIKNPPANAGEWIQSLGWENPLEEEMATHSTNLAWKNPMDKAARVTVLRSQRIGHNIETKQQQNEEHCIHSRRREGEEITFATSFQV